MASKAKELRDEGELAYISVYNDLKATLVKSEPRKRTITKGVGLVNKAWERLEKLHADYCRYAKLGLTSSESMEYIADRRKLSREVLETAEEVLDEGGVGDDKLSVEKLGDELLQLKLSVEGDIGAISSLVEGELSAEQHIRTKEILGKLESNLSRYMQSGRDLSHNMVELEGKEKMEEVEEFYKTKYLKFKELMATVVKKTPAKEEVSSKEEKISPHPVTSPRGEVYTQKQPVKIKAMECPKWDGKYRTFVRFRKLWEENIEPRHEDTALHYMLCQSLPKKVLDNISTLSNSASEIWTYLDDKYGRPEVVAREIMAELLSLDHKKLGQQFMAKFCTMLLDTHSLLVTLNEVDWLFTNKYVAELEDRLPREEKVEWARQMGTVSGDTKFEKFRNFLQIRKAVIESVELMGSKSDKSSCAYCDKPGHIEDNCYTKQREQGSSGKGSQPSKSAPCVICGKFDHWKNECPDRNTDKDKGPGSGKYKKNSNKIGGKQEGNTSGREVGSKTVRAL